MKVLRGTVLAPEEVLHGGEVLIDERGVIVCAACDCTGSAGYDTASVIACPDGVISPGSSTRTSISPTKTTRRSGTAPSATRTAATGKAPADTPGSPTRAAPTKPFRPTASSDS